MEIRDLIKIIAKRWPFIVSSAIIFLLGSALIAFFALSNVYQADTTMIIASDAATQVSLNDYTLNTKLVDSYRVLCTTDKILSLVFKDPDYQAMNVSLSEQQLSKKISVTAESDTDIIRISVQDADPATAVAIANAVANAFVSEIPKFLNTPNVKVIDKAVPNNTPIKPDRKLIVVVASLLGLLLGIGISVLVDYLDVSLKSTEQLEKLLEAPVLGSVPHMQERD